MGVLEGAAGLVGLRQRSAPRVAAPAGFDLAARGARRLAVRDRALPDRTPSARRRRRAPPRGPRRPRSRARRAPPRRGARRGRGRLRRRRRARSSACRSAARRDRSPCAGSSSDTRRSDRSSCRGARSSGGDRRGGAPDRPGAGTSAARRPPRPGRPRRGREPGAGRPGAAAGAAGADRPRRCRRPRCASSPAGPSSGTTKRPSRRWKRERAGPWTISRSGKLRAPSPASPSPWRGRDGSPPRRRLGGMAGDAGVPPDVARGGRRGCRGRCGQGGLSAAGSEHATRGSPGPAGGELSAPSRTSVPEELRDATRPSTGCVAAQAPAPPATSPGSGSRPGDLPGDRPRCRRCAAGATRRRPSP